MSLEERFWEKVDRGEPDECWEWQASTYTSGYGSININGYMTGAHRVAYELEHGEQPGDDWVLHHCDNKLCVNPDHLYLGDRSDNAKDAFARGLNSNEGERNPRANLTEDDVAEIRERASEGESQYDLADEFGIDQSTVTHILTGRTWSETLPDDWEWSTEPRTGEDNPNAKLTEDDVRTIRQRVDNGETQAEVADDFDISSSYVSMIVRGERWSDVE